MKVKNINNPLIWLLLEPVAELWQLEKKILQNLAN
jgi:hypothetical protein